MKRGSKWRRPAGKDAAYARGGAISDLTAQRLSIYLRCLEDLEKAGVQSVSSHALADRFHLNSAQIRKDLACFGEFGVRGVGYIVADLKRNLVRILGLTRNRKVVIVGAGNLGMALADYGGFNREGFSIVALFDSDPGKVGGASRGGVPVLDVRGLPEVAKRERVSIAVLAVPAAAAQKALDLVIRSGIRAVLNFAPARLRARAGITLKAVDLKIQLENLAFHLARAEGA
ncbi:MAG TPA: redox-sensing transcriptional repressor Rex [Candidatus Polarisedimenticolia bacterium]|nr:redox-sensing transcriptional repressor Rex [Candidatus Polarisedimenticolia bacterium]